MELTPDTIVILDGFNSTAGGRQFGLAGSYTLLKNLKFAMKQFVETKSEGRWRIEETNIKAVETYEVIATAIFEKYEFEEKYAYASGFVLDTLLDEQNILFDTLEELKNSIK